MSINVQEIKDVITKKRLVLKQEGQTWRKHTPKPFVSKQEEMIKEIDEMYTKIVKLESYNIDTVARQLNIPFDEAAKLTFKVLNDDYKVRKNAEQDEHLTK